MRLTSVATLLLLAPLAAAGIHGSIGGRVFDADGKGLADVIVTARSIGDKDSPGHPAVTDAEGRYLIETLLPGVYTLKVTRLMLREPAKGEKVTFGDMLKQAEPVAGIRTQDVLVEIGGRAEKDLRMERVVTVTVAVTQDGKPFADVPVRLQRLKDVGLADLLIKEPEPRRTDARGELSFPGTVVGSYGVVVLVGDWEVHCGTVDAAGNEPLRVPVAVGSRKARVRVLDSRGKPVPSVFPAMRAEGGLAVQPKDRAKSATGVYEIPCLLEGKYVPSAVVGAARAKGEAVEIGAGAPDPEVTLTLPPTGSLVVRVLDRAGKPLREQFVTVEPPSGIPSFSGETDAKGEVRFTYLTVGKWSVESLSTPGKKTADVKDGAEAKVTIKP